MAKGTEARLRGSAEKVAGTATWALSPTDLTFLWDECRHCFYMKVARNQPRPRGAFPRVFGVIDRVMKDFYLGKRADVLQAGMPLGAIGGRDRWVKSAPTVPAGSDSAFLIRGRVDVLVEFADQTTGIIDFKTIEPNPAHIAAYGRKLHAYAFALEHPATGRPRTVSVVGLLCFSPGTFETRGERAALVGDVRWIEIPRDDVSFCAFLAEVAGVLGRPNAPPPAPDCSWCSWEPSARQTA
jgi:hypothetical protein